jgi:hypothetical protein
VGIASSLWGSGEGGWRRREMGGGSMVAGIDAKSVRGCFGGVTGGVWDVFAFLVGLLGSRVESRRVEVVVGEEEER